MKIKFRHVLIIFSLMVWIIGRPATVFMMWSLLFVLPEMLISLPAALSEPQRVFLYGLWTGGILYFSALIWVAVTHRSKGYLIAAVAQITFVIGLTLFNIPIGEQNQRRWQSMNQLASPAWEDFLYDRHARFIQITQLKPVNQMAVIARFNDLKKPLAEKPLGWNEADAAAADALWKQALGNREQEAKALPRMANYLTWMQDRGDLTLATALLTLTTDANKAQAVTAFRRTIAMVPDNPEAWLGWAVALIQSRDNERVRNSLLQPLTQSITTGLLMAEGLKDSPRQPALQQRLAAYIAQMPPEDRQILQILQARMQKQTCASPLKKYEREEGESGKALPLSRSIVFKEGPVSDTSLYFPGHVSIEAERYGIAKETLPPMPYPGISKYIESATTILSVDTHVSGDLLNVEVECSSGIPQFDKAALHYAQRWRFHTNPQGRRLLIPVTFVSDRIPPQKHYQEMEARAIRIARMAARHNKSGMENAASEMLTQFERVKMFYPQKKLSLDETLNLQQIFLKKRENNRQGRIEAFTEMTEAMEALVKTHPYYAPLLKDLALRKTFGSFDKQRAEWSQLLALAPDDPQVWLAWGSLWIERDPELFLGSMVYARQLFNYESDIEQKIGNIRISMLMRGGSSELSRILESKASTLYADIIPVVKHEAKEQDLTRASEIAPVNNKLARHEKIWPTDPQRTMRVDIRQGEALSGERLGVPMLNYTGDGEWQSELEIDIDESGAPTLVLVTKSSGIEEYDAQALNMLWGWRFKGQPGGGRVNAVVYFQRAEQSLP